MSDENQTTEVEETPEDTTERNWEAEAKAQGWNPDYDGPNAKSAQEFVEVGERIDYKRELTRLKADMSEMKKAAKAFHSMSQKQAEKAKQERDNALAKLAEIKKQAISEGDGEAFAKAEAQERQIEAQPLDDQQDSHLQELNQAFEEKYADVLSVPLLEKTALGIANDLRTKNPHMSADAYYAELGKQVEEAAAAFNKPVPKSAPKTEGATRSGQSSGGKSFSDLPKEAQKAYHSWANDLKTMGVEFSKEEYLAEYQWD